MWKGQEGSTFLPMWVRAHSLPTQKMECVRLPQHARTLPEKMLFSGHVDVEPVDDKKLVKQNSAIRKEPKKHASKTRSSRGRVPLSRLSKTRSSRSSPQYSRASASKHNVVAGHSRNRSVKQGAETTSMTVKKKRTAKKQHVSSTESSDSSTSTDSSRHKNKRHHKTSKNEDEEKNKNKGKARNKPHSRFAPSTLEEIKESASIPVRESRYIGAMHTFSLSASLQLLEFMCGRYSQRSATVKDEQSRGKALSEQQYEEERLLRITVATNASKIEKLEGDIVTAKQVKDQEEMHKASICLAYNREVDAQMKECVKQRKLLSALSKLCINLQSEVVELPEDFLKRLESAPELRSGSEDSSSGLSYSHDSTSGRTSDVDSSSSSSSVLRKRRRNRKKTSKISTNRRTNKRAKGRHDGSGHSNTLSPGSSTDQAASRTLQKAKGKAIVKKSEQAEPRHPIPPPVKNYTKETIVKALYDIEWQRPLAWTKDALEDAYKHKTVDMSEASSGELEFGSKEAGLFLRYMRQLGEFPGTHDESNCDIFDCLERLENASLKDFVSSITTASGSPDELGGRDSPSGVGEPTSPMLVSSPSFSELQKLRARAEGVSSQLLCGSRISSVSCMAANKFTAERISESASEMSVGRPDHGIQLKNNVADADISEEESDSDSSKSSHISLFQQTPKDEREPLVVPVLDLLSAPPPKLYDKNQRGDITDEEQRQLEDTWKLPSTQELQASNMLQQLMARIPQSETLPQSGRALFTDSKNLITSSNSENSCRGHSSFSWRENEQSRNESLEDFSLTVTCDGSGKKNLIQLNEGVTFVDLPTPTPPSTLSSSETDDVSYKESRAPRIPLLDLATVYSSPKSYKRRNDSEEKSTEKITDQCCQITKQEQHLSLLTPRTLLTSLERKSKQQALPTETPTCASCRIDLCRSALVSQEDEEFLLSETVTSQQLKDSDANDSHGVADDFSELHHSTIRPQASDATSLSPFTISPPRSATFLEKATLPRKKSQPHSSELKEKLSREINDELNKIQLQRSNKTSNRHIPRLAQYRIFSESFDLQEQDCSTPVTHTTPPVERDEVIVTAGRKVATNEVWNAAKGLRSFELINDELLHCITKATLAALTPIDSNLPNNDVQNTDEQPSRSEGNLSGNSHLSNKASMTKPPCPVVTVITPPMSRTPTTSKGTAMMRPRHRAPNAVAVVQGISVRRSSRLAEQLIAAKHVDYSSFTQQKKRNLSESFEDVPSCGYSEVQNLQRKQGGHQRILSPVHTVECHSGAFGQSRQLSCLLQRSKLLRDASETNNHEHLTIAAPSPSMSSPEKTLHPHPPTSLDAMTHDRAFKIFCSGYQKPIQRFHNPVLQENSSGSKPQLAFNHKRYELRTADTEVPIWTNQPDILLQSHEAHDTNWLSSTHQSISNSSVRIPFATSLWHRPISGKIPERPTMDHCHHHNVEDPSSLRQRLPSRPSYTQQYHSLICDRHVSEEEQISSRDQVAKVPTTSQPVEIINLRARPVRPKDSITFDPHAASSVRSLIKKIETGPHMKVNCRKINAMKTLNLKADGTKMVEKKQAHNGNRPRCTEQPKDSWTFSLKWPWQSDVTKSITSLPIDDFFERIVHGS